MQLPYRAVTEIRSSYYFHPVAEVYILECGHRQVLPAGLFVTGETMPCPFCEDKDVTI